MKTSKYNKNSVDWSLTPKEIAKYLKCSVTYARKLQQKYGSSKRVNRAREKTIPEFVVEDNISLVPRGTPANINYPFKIMAVGQSFFFAPPLKANKVRYAAKQACPDWKWTCRSVRDSSGKVIGERIWRIE